jgi:predicted AlkP superfamily pyrophosphatase or phosphodiesterase
MKKLFSLFCLATILTCACTVNYAQDKIPSKPKLIVGIVVDQMRYDYLTRYWDKFGDGGFRKLVDEGFSCTNTHFNYVPTYTAPGHASIYTGTTPSVHGIISNDWYDRKLKRNIYVTDDMKAKGTGTDSLAGRMSPVNLLTTTFTDELKLASNLRSKVIGIALKDRSAILPAGHAADAAYWFEAASGKFITSSWYLDTLPKWVSDFNKRQLPASYLKKPWTTLLPLEQYSESTPDDSPYEELFIGETKPVFPHNFNTLGPLNFEYIKRSPYGSMLTKEMALAAISAEQLGKDEFTDVVAVSFSSPDYVGHQFGTHAIETEDTYLRLDKDIAELIQKTEALCGKENVLFFLTADHGAVQNIKFLYDQKIPASIFNVLAMGDSLRKYLNTIYGVGSWISSIDNDQVYLDHELLEQNKKNLSEMTDKISEYLLNFEGIAGTFTAKTLYTRQFTTGIAAKIQNGYNRIRSGDVVFYLQPGQTEYSLKGTTHGSAYTYDTHVPLLFYGWKIKHGATSSPVDITDIAPTISQMLLIQPPNGATGKVITQVLQ